MAAVLYTILSVVLVSLVSLTGILTILLGRKDLNKILLSLVSLSAGSLLGGAFLHLLPEVVEEKGFGLFVSLSVLGGVVLFFIIERFIHFHKCDKPEQHTHHMAHIHHHKHHLGVLNLIGDAVHNFADGLIIAGSYLVSIPVGVATTMAVIFHEVPQELADFGVLLYAGFSKWKALWYNFLSAMTSILGAVIGLILGAKSQEFVLFILPFAAGGFIYIAGANLIPELHHECKLKNSILHLFFLLLGMAIMVGLLYLE
ncbi:ZIP family metal transporter [Candidatus Woesearchaeota archaeon CG10_big_fil_rev_8_21_14_0_10_45_16]|nr:MAG: ZIP family metal transporter [Candidatus Woesearchaeota archaeon CG10_big_fil_rev_8_21_14_0_10_45_16]